MKQLIEWKPDINISANNEEVLYNCCHKGNLEMLLYIKEKNPNMNIRIRNDEAFRIVAKRGYLEMMRK